MTAMAWVDEFNTGIELVDQQHQWLVDQLNRAAQLLSVERRKTTNDDFDVIITDMLSYAKKHFCDEEALITETGLDTRHIEARRQIHVDFVERMEKLVASKARGKRAALLNEFSSWLALHILDEDQRMAAEIRAVNQGMNAAQAWDTCNGEQIGRLRDANKALAKSMLTSFNLMQRANVESDALARERTRDIERMATELDRTHGNNDELKRKKSSALAALSHEMLTPLNAILGFSHLLSESAMSGTDRDYISGIEKAGAELYTLFSQILMYARLEARGNTFISKSFDPSVLASLIEDRIGKTARGKKLTLHIKSSAPGCSVIGDADLLSDSIAAICTDVVRHTNSGMVYLREEHIDEGDQLRISFSIRYTPERTLVVNTASGSDAMSVIANGLGFNVGSSQLERIGALVESERKANGQQVIRINFSLDKANSPPAAESEPLNIDDALNTLVTLLQQDDLQAKQLFQQHRDAFKLALGEETAAAIAVSLDKLDLSDGLSTLNSALGGVH